MTRGQGPPPVQDWGTRSQRWAGVRSETITVRGTAVHVLRADGPPAGPVQLLVHGLGGAAANWLDVIGGLAARGPVIAPDLPGFGRTRPPRAGGSRVRGNAAFLAALLETVGVERVEIHGNSMGGLISVLFAARFPASVERLILVDRALAGPRTKLHRIPMPTLASFVPFAIPGAGRLLVRRLYTTRTAHQLYDDNQHYIHVDPSRVSPAMIEVGRENVAFGQLTPWRLDGFVSAAESIVGAIVPARGLVRAVREVSAPTLVVWGDGDQLIGRPVIEVTAALRPDWELRILEGVGHAPMIEVPDDYLAVVTDWLPQVAGRR